MLTSLIGEKMSVEICQKILEICQKLYARNMLAAADGNVSYLCDNENIIITPTGRAKAFIGEDELATIDKTGKVLKGNPSGEYLMHLKIYERCPTARAVVHAHPPTAIAWTIAYPDLVELPGKCLPEVILAVGKIPIVSYARPGTKNMGTVLENFLPDNKVMILPRHGALSWGEGLDEAYWGMERIEHCAEILKSAKELGGLSDLEAREVKALMEMREKMGKKHYEKLRRTLHSSQRGSIGTLGPTATSPQTKMGNGSFSPRNDCLY